VTTDSFLTIPVAEIVVPNNRARDLDPAWAEALAAIIRAQGLQNPITVRDTGGKYTLVSGLHRLEAYRLSGTGDISCTLSSATTEDAARLEEVMENLGRAELIALDRCHHLYELKQVYERLYPETKNGGNKNVKKGLEDTRTKSFRSGSPREFFSFTFDIAQKVGLSQRAIQIAVKIWTQLTPDSRLRLKGTDLARKQTELTALSELTAVQQAGVLALILGDDHEVDSVAAALVLLNDGALPDAHERKFSAACRTLSALDDLLFERVLIANEERVIASLKSRGRI